MTNIDKNAIKAIVFDVFGTLVEICDKRAPFRHLIQMGTRQGRKPSKADFSMIMSRPMGLRQAADMLGIELTRADYEHLQRDLNAEVSSIRPFTDTLPTLNLLRNRGFKLGLCSNLALDYAATIRYLLPIEFNAYVWSFETETIKPEPAIYARTCQQLCCAPCDVLMVGDTQKADVEGPREFGMQALLLDRRLPSKTHHSICSLSVLCELI